MPRCPERELLESDLKQAVKRWTDMEDKATAAIGNFSLPSKSVPFHANNGSCHAKAERIGNHSGMWFRALALRECGRLRAEGSQPFAPHCAMLMQMVFGSNCHS